MSHCPPTLLSLPPELLLYAASALNGATRNESLCALALTARGLRPIAQEVLICSPRFQLDCIHMFAFELGKNSKYINKIRKLEIYSSREGSERWGVQPDDEPADALEYPVKLDDKIFRSKRDFRETCEDVIEYHADTVANKKLWIRALDTDPVAALLGILLIILENLKELNTGASWMMEYPIFRHMVAQGVQVTSPEDWSHPYLAVVSRALQGRLTAMEVPTDTKGLEFQSLGVCATLDFHRFDHMKELSLSMRALSYKGNRPWRLDADPGVVLPPSIEILRICDCNDMTANLTNQLCLLYKKGNFPALHRVELYSKYAWEETAEDAEMTQSPHPVVDTRDTFADAGLELYIYFPTVVWHSVRFGDVPWNYKAEGALLEVERSWCESDTLSRPFEMTLDHIGDVKMGGME